MNHLAIFFAVPVLYAGIQALELTAVLARISGTKCGAPMLGFSIQQTVYMGTRLLLVAMLPMLGYLVDSGISLRNFAIMSHASLLLAGILGSVVLVNRRRLVSYYIGVIVSYKENHSLWRAFLKPHFNGNGKDKVSSFAFGTLKDKEARKIFFYALIVFVIYASGVFLSFYISAAIPEYRATLSQMSGIFNALGAFLLTFILEPKISSRIDDRAENASDLIMALFLGRLFAIALVAQVFIFTMFWLINV